MAETREARTLSGVDVGRRVDARGLHGVIASICHTSGVVDVEVSVGARYPTGGMNLNPTDLVTVRDVE